MGLTFHYEFRLPPSYSSAEIDGVIRQLKDRAQRLRFQEVTTTYEGVVDFLPDDWRQFFNICVDVNSHAIGEEERPYSVDAITARGFLARPGKGTDAAAFGFMLRQFDDDGSREWLWRGFCKTQYASVYGEQHFLDCHLRLVDMMEYAMQCGIDVFVVDEGQYWETRDREVLLAELDKSNRLIAGLAGRLYDSPLSVEAVIFEHPDFEHLEGG